MIDEAHRNANLSAVKLLLREARAYGVAVFLSSQPARDFADDIYANADTLIGLKLNEPRDAERLGSLLAGSAQARDLADSHQHTNYRNNGGLIAEHLGIAMRARALTPEALPE